MKTYILTSYIPNSEIDTHFLKALRKYAEFTNATLRVPICKPNYVKDVDEELHIESLKFLGKNVLPQETLKFNDNLFITDYRESINVIDPLSGMESIASSLGSMIIPYPRHRFKTIPRMLREGHLPRALWCTGVRMARHHKIGAIIIEVENDEIFHIRQITWNGRGFFDLQYYVTPSSVKGGYSAVSISMGDDHAVFQNAEVMNQTEKVIEYFRPKYIFRHDTFDACTVTHHTEGKSITKALINMSLEEEGIITSNSIQRFCDLFPFAKQFMVASNHPEHLDRYLDEARYKEDTKNHILALELAWKKASGFNVVEYLLKKYNKLQNVTFLDRKKSIKVLGTEFGDHGDEGANGSRGTPVEKGIVYGGKCVTGHTHSPEIGVYSNFVNGTSTNLSLGYTKDSGSSSWLNTHTIQYKDGSLTHIHIIPVSNRYNFTEKELT